MKAKAAMAMVGVIVALAVGCAVVPGAEVSKGVVTFKGEGTAVAAKEGDPLSLEEARLAAATIAKANLLANIKGEFVMGRVSVEGLMFEGQEATCHVEGFLSRAIIEYPPRDRLAPPSVVKAVATLRLSCEEVGKLRRYVE